MDLFTLCVIEKQNSWLDIKPRVQNAQLFLISIFRYYNFCPLSDPVKWDPILDQFSMITRPYIPE